MALVGDDEVEVPRGEPAVLRDHGLEGRNGDALCAIEAAPRAKDVAGVVTEVVGEGVLGLGGEGDPVHEEEDAGNGSCLEEALDERGRGAGLAGPRRHFDEELPAPACHLARESIDAIDLVAAVDDPPVDRDIGEGAADGAGRNPAFEVFLRVEGRDRAGVGVRVPVEEPHLVAVREEDERDVELLRVVAPLVLGGDRIDARALCLDHRHRPPGAVAEHVVRPRTVAKRVLEEDARPVGQVPPGVRKQRVDLDPGERLGGRAHRGTRVRRRPALSNYSKSVGLLGGEVHRDFGAQSRTRAPRARSP